MQRVGTPAATNQNGVPAFAAESAARGALPSGQEAVVKLLVERLLALREKGTALEREAVRMRLVKKPSSAVKGLIQKFESRFDAFGRTLAQYIDQKLSSVYLPHPDMARFLEPLQEFLVLYLTEEGGPKWQGRIQVVKDLKGHEVYRDMSLSSCMHLADVGEEVFEEILREKDLEEVPASQKPQPVRPVLIRGRPPARRPG